MFSDVFTCQLINDRKGATQIVNNNLLWGLSEQHFSMSAVNNKEKNKKNGFITTIPCPEGGLKSMLVLDPEETADSFKDIMSETF